jgi:hypothetical protein
MMDLGLLQKQKGILIIDNDLDVTISLQLVPGFRTDSFTDPVLSNKNVRDGQYVLVLFDIEMPVVDEFLLYQGYWIDFK